MRKLLLSLTMLVSISTYAQDDKTATIVVSGNGKTQEEAKQNALRSAIEQAFGTFISSETVINNDRFISDNITSLSQGSVLDFKVLALSTLPDSTTEVTLKAKVSISQMLKITESKGYTTSINGGLFGLNLNLLKLQSEAEKKVVLEMARKGLKMLEKSIDYKLEVSLPKKSDIRLDVKSYFYQSNYPYDIDKIINHLSFNDIFKLRITVECRPNNNLDVFIDYFLKTLSAIEMSDSEIEFAKQSGIECYKIDSFYLRNLESIRLIDTLFEKSTLFLVNYDIISNNEIINYTPFFKKGRKKNQNSDYEILTYPFFRSEKHIQVIDTNYYVFIHELLGTRKLNNGYELEKKYPTNTSLKFFKTDSYLPFINGGGSKIDFFFLMHPGGESDKSLDSKDNMNVRFQVLDFYIPLSNVKKLENINIIKHESTSKAK